MSTLVIAMLLAIGLVVTAIAATLALVRSMVPTLAA
jgi:hypothetical protein